MMLELALKGGLPFVGIQTDDLVNLERVLKHLSVRKIKEVSSTAFKSPSSLLIAYDLKWATADNYELTMSADSQVVFVNCEPHPLVFDAGMLHPPKVMLKDLLETQELDEVPGLLNVLSGLSLKAAQEVLLLTEAKYGDALPAHVRELRGLMGETIQGLYPQDTTYDFYVFPEELRQWLTVNKPYFLVSQIQKLVPRGLLFQGPPGTGKTLAAKAIANDLGVPLYRLDIGTTMDKYTGVSEARLARILQQVEKEQPCVLLVDEIEKAFAETEESGVLSRMLSQLLWWLSEHRARVLTVFTANATTVPPELYRAGRIDLVMTIDKLKLWEAKQFAVQVLQSIAGSSIQQSWKVLLFQELEMSQRLDFAHAEVAELVYQVVKRQQWLF